MHIEGFDLDAYLSRIGVSGPLPPTAETLRRLHHAHVLRIPFENIDAFLGRTPDLSPAALHRKMVCSPRGGWCYEHVHLFSLALEHVGIRAEKVLARPRYLMPPGETGPRGHLTLVATLPDGERFLCELAYGNATLTGPVALREGEVQETSDDRCRVLREEGMWLLQVHRGGRWTDVMLVGDGETSPADIDFAHWTVANRPENLPTENVIISIPVQGGRMTLTNRRMAVAKGWDAGKEEATSADALDSMREALKRFGIRIEDPDVEKMLAKLGQMRPGRLPVG
ncbi:hypothetical protein DFJ74DRAFT_57257 [Hyaloraphidium curvatum]|nr:hypothetical protein DFJ74DRAFT_57257 [Hyaloraphidium curvatum]